MKKVNFTQVVIGMDGKEIKDVKEQPIMLNETIGNTISTSKAENDAIRQMTIAHAIYNADGEIELEDSDFNMVKSILKKSTLTSLVVAQAMTIMKEAEKTK